MKESKTKHKACSICGVVHEVVELTELDGKLLCPECIIRETAVCSRCGERIWYSENSGDSSTILCQSCCDEYYTYCCECDRLILREDAYYEDGNDEPLCYRCYEDGRSHDYIEDYYYKPTPIFYGSGNRFFGVELEIDGAGESDSSASSVMDIANSNGLEHIISRRVHRATKSRS